MLHAIIPIILNFRGVLIKNFLELKFNFEVTARNSASSNDYVFGYEIADQAHSVPLSALIECPPD
jgi:hypothetical protein